MRCFRTRNLLLSKKCVPLHCVFHSIRFKVNKGWSTAVLLFLCPYLIFTLSTPFTKKLIQIDISSSYVLLKFAYATPYLLPLYRLGVGKE